MLSKFWARAWRGLASIKGNREEHLLKNVLISQYEQLSREIEDTKTSTLSYQEFKNNPFSKERVVVEQTNDTTLRNIFSLQNLKLLGTKEGSELIKLQEQLSAQLKDQFDVQNWPSLQPPTQNTPSNKPTPKPQAFTDEDKEVISRLTTTDVHINVHEADIPTLRQLIQDKQSELEMIKSNDDNFGTEQKTEANSTNAAHDSTDKNNINDDAVSGLVEQIRQYTAMKAAGAAPDKLPKIDFSNIPTSTLKQIRQLSQQSHPANKKEDHSDK